MRCPQCGDAVLANRRSGGIVSGFCESCEQGWEWVAGQVRVPTSGRRAAGRKARRSGEVPRSWRGRLLQAAAEAEVVSVG